MGSGRPRVVRLRRPRGHVCGGKPELANGADIRRAPTTATTTTTLADTTMADATAIATTVGVAVDVADEADNKMSRSKSYTIRLKTMTILVDRLSSARSITSQTQHEHYTIT